MGALVFVGNLLLCVGALLLISPDHVAVISGVEAKRLSKVRSERCWRPTNGFVSSLE